MADRKNSPVKLENISREVSGIGIVVSEWNSAVTEALYSGALNHLIKAGVPKEKITRINVPGSYELPFASQQLVQKEGISGVIALGCVIQGETRHFDFICSSVASGLMDVSLKYNKPVIFGVLTPNNQKQAMDRAGGKHGNKGQEAAYTLLSLLNLD